METNKQSKGAALAVAVCSITLEWALVILAVWLFCWGFGLPWSIRQTVGVYAALLLLRAYLRPKTKGEG